MSHPIRIYKKWKCYTWPRHGHYWKLGDATLSRSWDPGLLPGWFLHSSELDLDLQLTDSNDTDEYALLDEAERVLKIGYQDKIDEYHKLQKKLQKKWSDILDAPVDPTP